MVYLKVINGGKTRNDECRTEVKLFSAVSIVNNFQGRDNVRLNWICTGRNGSDTIHDKMIAGRCSANETIAPYLMEHMRELFTEDEIQYLKDYLLNAHGMEIEAREEDMAAFDVFMPMPYGNIPAGKDRGFYHLPEDKRWTMPFSVSAFYDLCKCPVSLSLHEETKEKCGLYLLEALKSLGLEGHVGVDQVQAAVEMLYDKHGLYVRQGKNREMRLREKLDQLF